MTSQLDIFQVIADSSRRQMLHLLSKEKMSINDLADNFDMSRPAVSKHIKVLHLAGFISIEDSGRERYCTLKKDGFDELQEWMDYYEQFWAGKMNDLSALLDTKYKKGNAGGAAKNKKMPKKGGK